MLDQPSAAMATNFFKTKERRGEQLNVRMSKRLKAELAEIAKIWTKTARIQSRDDEVEVSMADVANNLLLKGVRKAWKEAGGRPKNPEDRERAIQALLALPPETEDEDDDATEPATED